MYRAPTAVIIKARISDKTTEYFITFLRVLCTARYPPFVIRDAVSLGSWIRGHWPRSSCHLAQMSDGESSDFRELSSLLNGAAHIGSFSSLGVGKDSSPIAWMGGS